MKNETLHLLGGDYYDRKISNILKDREPLPNAIEVCCGVGLIGKALKEDGIVDNMWYSDIVDMSAHCNSFILSDALESIEHMFDLIVCSPPWYNSKTPPKPLEKIDSILWQDLDWKFHKNFYNKLPSVLNKGGAALVTGDASNNPESWLDMCQLKIKDIYHFTDPRDSVEYPKNYIIEWAH